MFVLTIYIFLDAVHGTQSGNVRALGHQFVVSLLILGFYYALGLPLALYFGFSKGMGIKGFWMGMLVAETSLDLTVAYVVMTAKWEPKIGLEE